MKINEIAEEVVPIKSTEHAVERLKVAAEICSKMGNQPILYRAMHGSKYLGGAKNNLIQKITNPARAGASYSGRKLAPHWLMQCASSMAIRLRLILRKAAIIRSVINRSGARYRIGTSPAATARQMRTFSSRLWAEFMLAALTPASFSAAT